MRRIVRIRILPAMAMGLLLCGVGLFWPASVKTRQFTVAVNIWPGVEGVLSARESRSAAGYPMNFVEFSWSSAVMGAFQKRVVDAAVVGLEELLLLEEGDAQPLAVLVVGISKGADAILTRDGIATVPELRGRRVGVELHSSGEYLLMSSLAKHGLKLTDVQVVPLNLAETETAYLEQDVDAVATADPWRVRLLHAGAVTLDDSKHMGLEMCRVLVVRRDAVKDFREEVRRLVEAGLDHADPRGAGWAEAGLGPVLRRQGLTRDQWDAALKLIEVPGREANIRLLGGELTPVLQQIAVRMRAVGSLERNFSVDHLTSPDIVKEVGP